MKLLPVDAFAVKTIGISTWQKDFYWPVSDSSYFSLLDAIWGPVNELFQSLNSSFQDCLLADIGFLDFMAQWLHASQVQAFCRERPCKAISGRLSDEFYSPKWEKLARDYQWEQRTGTALRFQGRRLAKRVRFNAHLPLTGVLKGWFRDGGCWGLGSFSQLKADYIKRQGIYCDHHYVQTLLPRKITRANARGFQQLSEAIITYLKRIERYCVDHLDVHIQTSAAAECWLTRLKDLLSIYQTIREKKTPPRTLLLTEVAAPLHKAIALGMRRQGCGIIGFNHGNDMGNFWDPVNSYIEYSHCDEYVCPTAKSAESRARHHSRWNIKGFEETRFVSADTSYYRRLVEKGRRDPFPKKVKSVMIMGYPMNAHRYAYSSGDFFVFQLDLELRVTQLLKQEGYEVIYKAHPHRRKEVEGIFDSLVDRILLEPFENVYSRADAYFFGCITSSTFGFALCMNKPIYVIDLESKIWNPEAYKLLSRRCVMIPAGFDEANRIQFSTEHLLQSLTDLPDKPDFSYVESFMFAPPPSTDGRLLEPSLLNGQDR